MNWAAKNWPIFGAVLVSCFLVAALTITRDVNPTMSPLLPPIRVTLARAPTRGVDPVRPIFAGQTTEMEPVTPSPTESSVPTLVGIVRGAGTAIALVKSADGQVTRAQVGDVVDGWTLRSLSTKSAKVSNSQREREIVLFQSGE